MPIEFYKSLGRIFSKIIRKDFLITNSIFYPENCLYEDNYLIFTMPIYVKKFMKVDDISYVYNTECESITRGDINESFFDRVLTGNHGYSFYCEKSNKSKEVDRIFAEKHKSIVLTNTLSKVIFNFKLKYIKHAMNTVSSYKEIIKKNNTTINIFISPSTVGMAKSFILNSFIALSILMNRKYNEKFFYDCNKITWKGRAIKFK
ncbi:TPA: hypothetical protein ACS72N_000034 [Providencia alcalifaciens]